MPNPASYRIIAEGFGWRAEDYLAIQGNPRGRSEYVHDFADALRTIQRWEQPCPECSQEWGDTRRCNYCEGSGIDPDVEVA